jgi:hypothetical protein
MAQAPSFHKANIMANSIVSEHGKYIRGASGYFDEVDETRRVVENVAG